MHSKGDYESFRALEDDEYIRYKQWENTNNIGMYKKHLPDTILVCGTPDNIVFHGGCLGCRSQQIHGIERCKRCQYFKAEWSKENLFILE